MSQEFQADSAFVLITVPHLRPRPDRDRPTPWLRFFDPGVVGLAGPCYRPADLPLDETQVAAMMARFAGLAREVRRPEELAGLREGVYEDFHSDTSFAVRDRLARALAGEDRAAQAFAQARIRAQTLVCLALALEEQALGMRGLEAKLDAQWQNFEKSLDLGDESLAEALGEDGLVRPFANPVAPGRAEKAVTAAMLVESILTLLPPGIGLYTEDADLLSAWDEFGVVFSPGDRPGLLAAVAPGHRLALRRRADADKPWLAGLRNVYTPGE